jgi:flagellar protein FliT
MPDMQHVNQSKAADILRAYEHLADVTGRMRIAACEEDWDSVIELETECASVYERLLSVDQSGAFGTEYQQRKAELIRKLLDNDAQIRERVSGQLTRIWRLLEGGPKVQRLNSAYGTAGVTRGGE